MSSLRLALKQSLQETGHVLPKDKKKKSSSNKKNIARSERSSNPSNNQAPLRRRKRQPGDPPRKRGRPRKYPRPEDLEEGATHEEHIPERLESHPSRSRSRPSDDDDDDGDHHSENSFSSENEFSYDSEDSQGEDEEEDDDEEEEDDDEEDEDDDEEDEGESPNKAKEDGTESSPVGRVPVEADDEKEVEGDEDEDTTMGEDGHAKKRSKKMKRLAAAAEAEESVAPNELRGAEATSSDDDYKKQRKLKKQLKHMAANKIQFQWKRKRDQSGGGSYSAEEGEEGSTTDQVSVEPNESVSPEPPKKSTPVKESSGNSTATANSGKKKRRDKNDSNSTSTNNGSGRSKTVPPPASAILDYAKDLSEKKWRRNIGSGMRVKVRFATKVRKEGKVIKKKKWYGGLVSAVSKDGSKIRIKYDDGTMEVSKFPDKDIVVDDEYNGEHLVNAEKFLPPVPPPVMDEVAAEETEDEMEMELANASEPTAEESTKTASEGVGEKRAAEVKSPHAGQRSPHAGSKSPHSGRKSPHSGRKSPHSGQKSPHSRGKSSLVDDVEDARVPVPEVATDPEPGPKVVETVHADIPPEQMERSKAPPTPEPVTEVEPVKPPSEDAKVIRMTPVAVVPVISQSTPQVAPLGSKERPALSVMGLASPEEGELSPGFTFSKESSKRTPFKPIDMASLDPETAMTKPAAEHFETSEVALPVLSAVSHDGAVDSNQEEESQATSTEANTAEPAPKLSLTIRIPNIKAESLVDSVTKKREEVAPRLAEESDESTDEEANSEGPSKEQESHSTEPIAPAAAEDAQPPVPSRKRPLSDSPASADEGPPPSKKRIHLKNLDRVETPSIEKREEIQVSHDDETAIMGTLLQLKGGLVSNDTAPSKLDTTRALEEPLKEPATEMPERHLENQNKETKTISITLRRPSVEPELDDIDPSLPAHPLKMKRKKDLSERAVSPRPTAPSPHPRAASPKLRSGSARRSPGNSSRPSPSTVRSESPAPMSAEPKPVVEVSKPLSKPVSKPATMMTSELGVESTSPDQSNQKRPLVLTGSKNSAFERKQPIGPSKEEDDGEIPDSIIGNTLQVEGELGEHATAEGRQPVTPKLRDRSKASEESSQPAVRSGRRAAQQAKDKLNNKNDTPGMEGGKKKKKRKKKDGKESGDEGGSENSEDDRQWVQCDSCGKWRILPSRVKVSSLPKHWYCEMNTHDPKRSNCDAPEQTAKQVLKERKRAKKRARQRLEQAELEGIPEETRKEKRARVEAAKGTSSISANSPRSKDKDESPPKDSTSGSGEQRESKKAKRSSPALEASKEEPQPQPSDSGSEQQKDDKKSLGGKKNKTQQKEKEEKTPEIEAAAENPGEIPIEPPKVKPGRRRGRPRNPTKESRGSGQESKDDGENVEWVQCEKCEKWRKLPSHICADELPDVWYCSLNTWNADSATCESPEDKADALHQDVGNGSAVPGNPGKFSYRGLIFGTGRKHNRPMSERTRATESLFAKPVDDTDNPYPVVMYAKSSAFLPRTSNFTKGNQVEEKCIGVFDVMSNSDLWAELRGMNQPMTIISGGSDQSNKRDYTYDSLPDDVQKTMGELVLHALGSATLTGDQVLSLTQCRQWENVPPAWLELQNFCTEDIVVNALLQLVRDGVVEMTCSREADRAMSEWVPKYRLVRSRRRAEIDEAIKSSRCMKIRKPWKQRESDSQWISGGGLIS